VQAAAIAVDAPVTTMLRSPVINCLPGYDLIAPNGVQPGASAACPYQSLDASMILVLEKIQSLAKDLNLDTEKMTPPRHQDKRNRRAVNPLTVQFLVSSWRLGDLVVIISAEVSSPRLAGVRI
jgi:hypothetical protein